MLTGRSLSSRGDQAGWCGVHRLWGFDGRAVVFKVAEPGLTAAVWEFVSSWRRSSLAAAPALVIALHRLARRGAGEAEVDPVLKYEDLTLDLQRHEARRDGQRISLTTTEFRLLEFMMRNSTIVLSRSRILDEVWGFDAATVNCFGGGDSLEPFLEYADKGIFVWGRSSNPGADQFQGLGVGSGEDARPLFEVVASNASEWDRRGNVGLVVGATYTDDLRAVRAICPSMSAVS